jgi:hypothetical protein
MLTSSGRAERFQDAGANAPCSRKLERKGLVKLTVEVKQLLKGGFVHRAVIIA